MRIPAGTKNIYKKAWAAHVTDGIMTQKEGNEIQHLIDYRNLIGHRIQELTYDLSRKPFVDQLKELSDSKTVRYDYGAREKIKYYRNKICNQVGEKYIV